MNDATQFFNGAAGAAGGLGIEDVFSTWLYTGNGSTQTITNGIDLSGEGGITWIKSRQNSGAGNDHIIATNGLNGVLRTNLTNGLSGNPGDLATLGSNGFSVNTSFSGGTWYYTNGPSIPYTSWTFRKAPKFFDVVTYTGNGSNRTIAHNLGSVPGCIIVKSTSQLDNWKVYHRSLTSNAYYILLDSTAAQSNAVDLWNSTTPTSTEFSIGSSGNINTNGATYVAYLFAHDAGGFGNSGNDSVVKCGTFTTNANSGVTGEIALGWEPQWVMMKCSGTTSNWIMVDVMRGFSQTMVEELRANTTDAAVPVSGHNIYPTATGFGIANSTLNPNQPWIYIAIRRGPMKTPTDATEVFKCEAVASDANNVTTGFPVDLAMDLSRVGNNQWLATRLTGQGGLSTNLTNQEAALFVSWWDSNTVMKGLFATNTSAVYELFRRAPGFFDVVAYMGTGVARTVPHNLGVEPELIIVKRRDSVRTWLVYAGSQGVSKYLILQQPDPVGTSANIWGSASPTSSVFGVSSDPGMNASGGTYIAYLFATLPGISKVGSYIGTGTTLDIDCGFTAGARFVLIKRTDSTGDWYVWDTARGIVSGNDPYLLLNSTAAEVTNTDHIDPLSSGFQVSSTAPDAINASGGSYIFLAIA